MSAMRRVPDVGTLEIPRPRLTSLLDEARRITLVTALPGFGATTAVAQWARDARRPVTWLTVDAFDRDVTFLVDEDLPVDGTLVLDGIEWVEAVLGGDRSARLVEGLAERVPVVLIGGREPRLPLAKWRARGLVTDLDERDLAFDEAEALAVAAVVAPGRLDDDVLAMNHRLEGWPIGVVLALSAIRDAATPERARTVLTQPHHLLHDHVTDAIAARTTRRDRDLALALSVAESLDAETSRLLAGEDASVVVDRLRRARLLTPVAERPGTLRFHPVVRQVLDDRLSWVDPSRHADLHRILAADCTERGQLNEAHRHLVAAGQRDATTRLVMTPTVELSDAADRAGLLAMLGRMPRPSGVDDAALAFDIALAWVFAGSGRQAFVWCDRAQGLMDPSDEQLLPRLHATRCVLAMLSGDLESAGGHLDAFEALEPRAGLLPPVEGVLVSTAIRVALGKGDDRRARAWLDRARETVSNPVFDLIIASLAAWADLLAGKVRGPLARMPQVTADFATRGLRPHHGHFEALVVEAAAQLAAGNLERADRCASDALFHAELLNFDWNRVRAGAINAQVRLLRDGPAAGLAAAREARLGLDHPVSPVLMEPVDVVEVRALVRLGHLDAARTALATMDDSPARALAAADLAIADDRGDDVAGLLVDAAGWRVQERLAAECLASVAVGDDGERRLAAAVGEAASLGWVSPFLGHGRQVAALLRRLPLRRLHPDLAAHVLADAANAPSPLFEPLTARERTLLELLPSHLSYAEIGARLNLSVNTVKSNLKSIYRKLAVTTRSAAVAAATAHGLL